MTRQPNAGARDPGAPTVRYDAESVYANSRSSPQQLFDYDGLPLSPRPRKGVPGVPMLASARWPRSASDGSAA
jgi:hypothetical protein